MIKVLFAEAIGFVQLYILNTTKDEFLFKTIIFSIIWSNKIIIKLILPNYLYYFKNLFFSSQFFNKFQRFILLILYYKNLFLYIVIYSLHLCNHCFYYYVLFFLLNKYNPLKFIYLKFSFSFFLYFYHNLLLKRRIILMKKSASILDKSDIFWGKNLQYAQNCFNWSNFSA